MQQGCPSLAGAQHNAILCTSMALKFKLEALTLTDIDCSCSLLAHGFTKLNGLLVHSEQPSAAEQMARCDMARHSGVGVHLPRHSHGVCLGCICVLRIHVRIM